MSKSGGYDNEKYICITIRTLSKKLKIIFELPSHKPQNPNSNNNVGELNNNLFWKALKALV